MSEDKKTQKTRPAGFTVDTNIFRELGELLVGRDSTALAELIKNAYDADATKVGVSGTNLGDPSKGVITIIDNGHGMTVDTFKLGFLRVAGRQKEIGTRRSPKLERRFTGEKGIGRLAAHKLAHRIEIVSVPARTVFTGSAKPFKAVINWDEIERLRTLDEVQEASESETDKRGPNGRKVSPALQIREISHAEVPEELKPSGTRITLNPLRAKWSSKERVKLYNEAVELQFPNALRDLSDALYPGKRLIDFNSKKFKVRDEAAASGFNLELLGEFDVGETYWENLLSQNAWLLEIDATSKTRPIRYQISPSARAIKDPKNPGASQSPIFEVPRQNDGGPSFFARIVIRHGTASATDAEVRAFLRNTFGVRVYVEGFRVLPYGEAGNDWLRLDYDYARRNKTLGMDEDDSESAIDENAGLSIPSGRSVFGAVVMTQESSHPLRMLVNREGFVPDGAFDTVVETVKKGINLYVRQKASATLTVRNQSREARAQSREPSPVRTAPFSFDQAQRALDTSISVARAEASRAVKLIAIGQVKDAEFAVRNATDSLVSASQAASQMLPEQSLVRILASVGLQLGAFVHEVRAVHAVSAHIRLDVERHLERNEDLPSITRKFLRSLQRRMSDLTQSLERHASYLTDALSADARRRRASQPLLATFEKALRLVELQIERRKIKVIAKVGEEIKTPPMFGPELTLILTNLLSNAVKAAGTNGRMKLSARDGSDALVVTLENSGIAVNLKESERWFQPFESMTADPDPILGVGMGMGLPITRNMVETYGGDIRFVEPSAGYKTAISLTLPRRK